MAQTSAGAIRYFSNPFSDGSTGKPNSTAMQLHLLLSAQIHS
jgi:hypothetical protein